MLFADALFVGFLLLTRVEAGRGRRYFEGHRTKLDHKARKVEFILQHVDWGALIRDTTRTTLTAFAHEAAQRSLMLVRSTERFLTRAVQVLGMHREGLLPKSEGGVAMSGPQDQPSPTSVPSRPLTRINAGITQTRKVINVNAERIKHGLRAKKITVTEEEK